jgi:hypothetical protein
LEIQIKSNCSANSRPASETVGYNIYAVGQQSFESSERKLATMRARIQPVQQ